MHIGVVPNAGGVVGEEKVGQELGQTGGADRVLVQGRAGDDLILIALQGLIGKAEVVHSREIGLRAQGIVGAEYGGV